MQQARAWNDFRQNMPYGCDYDPATQSLQFFNRDYTYVGAGHGVWRDVPDACVGADGKTRRKYFYGDGSKPLQSADDMAAYLDKLGEFAGWSELENDKGHLARSTEYYLQQAGQYSIGM